MKAQFQYGRRIACNSGKTSKNKLKQSRLPHAVIVTCVFISLPKGTSRCFFRAKYKREHVCALTYSPNSEPTVLSNDPCKRVALICCLPALCLSVAGRRLQGWGSGALVPLPDFLCWVAGCRDRPGSEFNSRGPGWIWRQRVWFP